MNNQQLGWVAGLLEGEGCFKLNTKTVKGLRYHYANVELNMTDEDVIRKTHAIVGLGTVTGPYWSGRSADKQTWHWSIQKDEVAREFMRTVLPLMCERRSAKIAEILQIPKGLAQVWV